MQTLARRLRIAAIAACLGASLAAHAVNVSSDGTGQVLLYPYYTTRNGFVTSFTVVNTSADHTKAVKVHVREGKNSALVLDFNLFLSPSDTWSGAISDTGSGARITTGDKSCTTAESSRIQSTGAVFTNLYYMGQAAGLPSGYADNGGMTLDRTREGYIEVIEMGVVANGADADSRPATKLGTTVAQAVTGNRSTGLPNNCAAILKLGLFRTSGDLRRPVGGLTGIGILINASTGSEFAYVPVALQGFFRPESAQSNLYEEIGSYLPDLSSVSPARSDVFNSDRGDEPAVLTVMDWVAAGGQAIDAVSAVLMKSAIINEYDVRGGLKTDWVITAPTKRFYTHNFSNTPAPAIGPFSRIFEGSAPNAVSCDTVMVSQHDRESTQLGYGGIPPNEPPPGPTVRAEMCWSTTIMTVQLKGSAAASAKSIFGSINTFAVAQPGGENYPPLGDTAGWIALFPTHVGPPNAINGPGQEATKTDVVGQFVNSVTRADTFSVTPLAQGGLRNLAPVHTDGIARRYRGLPVIGFAAVGAVIDGQGYGGIFNHKHQVLVTP